MKYKLSTSARLLSAHETPRIAMTKKRILFPLLISLFLLIIIGRVDAQVQLRHKVAGSPASNYTNANSSTCQPAPPRDWQLSRFVSGMLQGYFHFEWTLFRDGQPFQFFLQVWDLRGNNALSYQNYTHQHTFLNLPGDPGVYNAKLEVKERGGSFWNYNFNKIVFNNPSPQVTISNVTPTHSFTIKNASGVFVAPPPGGTPIQVSLGGGVIMDASASACETGYLIIVEESNNA